jgi:glycosyltransferase involved in cell wall biosynthesis
MVAVHRTLGTWTNLVDSYIVLSEFSRRKFIEGGLPAEKIVVKPNFVYPDPGERTTAGDYTVFAGRLSPEKRVSTLLAAWQRLSEQIPLRILGGGPELRQLERDSRRRKLSHVTFYGHVPREQVVPTIRGARFLIFSSEWYEHFPVTIGESFACGTPVICARLGAMKEIVEDGRTGLHFNPGDAKDLASKVDWAWSHPEEMKCLGNGARKEYENKYTAEKNYPQLMEIYDRTIQSAAKTAHSRESSPTSAVTSSL